MGNTTAMDILAVTSTQEADGTQEAEDTPGPEGSVGFAEDRKLCLWTTWRIQAWDGLLCLAWSDLKGRSHLMTLRRP